MGLPDTISNDLVGVLNHANTISSDLVKEWDYTDAISNDLVSVLNHTKTISNDLVKKWEYTDAISSVLTKVLNHTGTISNVLVEVPDDKNLSLNINPLNSLHHEHTNLRHRIG